MVTEEVVWKTLKTVLDPELGVNVVDLGLIYEVKVFDKPGDDSQLPLSLDVPAVVEGANVEVLMTLTSPACPLAGMFDDLVGGSVRRLPGVAKVVVELTFDPPWSYDRVSEEAKAELGWL